MGHHTFPVDRADALEDPSRYRYCSRDELLAALGLSGSETVADLGSGTGFYTDDVAPYAETVYAVDVQAAMHDIYREKGLPENVETVTAGVAELPFEDGALDAAFSTMTYHEFATADALAEVRRVLAPDAPFVVVDWSADGEGESGPPVDERYGPEEARRVVGDAEFEIESLQERPETFLLVGRT